MGLFDPAVQLLIMENIIGNGKAGIITGGNIQLCDLLPFIILRNEHDRKVMVIDRLAVGCSQIILKSQMSDTTAPLRKNKLSQQILYIVITEIRG